MKRYIYGFLFALSITCLTAGQSAPPQPMGVRIDNPEEAKYPAKVEEWAIGEYAFVDKKGPNKIITRLAPDGERGLPGYMHPFIH